MTVRQVLRLQDLQASVELNDCLIVLPVGAMSPEFIQLYTKYRFIGLAVLLALLALYWFFFLRERSDFEGDSAEEHSEDFQSAALTEVRNATVLAWHQEQLVHNHPTTWLANRCREQGYLSELNNLKQLGEISSSAAVAADKLASQIPLTIELLPSSCAQSNLRTILSEAEWTTMCQLILERSHNSCQICSANLGGSATPYAVWEYDDSEKIQKLKQIIALCPECHAAKDFGLGSMQRWKDIAIARLKLLNKWNFARASSYVQKAFDLWSMRSQEQWQTDLSTLTEYGCHPPIVSESTG